MLLGSLLFVLGFAVVFVLVGAAFGASAPGCCAGRTRSRSCSASVLIMLGLVFAGVVPWLQRECGSTRSRRSGWAPRR